jgi:hypothetical protein
MLSPHQKQKSKRLGSTFRGSSHRTSTASQWSNHDDSVEGNLVADSLPRRERRKKKERAIENSHVPIMYLLGGGGGPNSRTRVKKKNGNKGSLYGHSAADEQFEGKGQGYFSEIPNYPRTQPLHTPNGGDFAAPFDDGMSTTTSGGHQNHHRQSNLAKAEYQEREYLNDPTLNNSNSRYLREAASRDVLLGKRPVLLLREPVGDNNNNHRFEATPRLGTFPKNKRDSEGQARIARTLVDHRPRSDRI